LLTPFSTHIIQWKSPEVRESLAQRYGQRHKRTKNVILALDCSDFLIEKTRSDKDDGSNGVWSFKLKSAGIFKLDSHIYNRKGSVM
jgi:hypothetical protein